MMIGKRRVIYEGSAKTVYEGTEPGTLVQHFKDDTSAFNGTKRALIAGKGVLNNRISAHLMTKLEGIGIPTHFLRSLNMREQLVRQVEIIPVSIVIRNVAAGSLCTRLGVKEGLVLPQPLIEYYYKKAAAAEDAMVNEHHIITFGWADPYEVEEMIHMAWRVNDYLNGLFTGIGLRLIDFRLEFGRLWGEQGELYLLLADEISPDNCRLWDAATGEKLDRDRFREDLPNVIEGYQQVAQRLGLIPKGGIMDGAGINEQIASSLGEIQNDLAKERGLRVLSKPPFKPRKV
jgi:phosphoribosylaminoimidazole-succinocarboxamide synthase